MKSAKTYIQENKERFLNELLELLKIPSISADSAYKKDVIKTAEAIKKKALKKQVVTSLKSVKHPATLLYMARRLSTKPSLLF